MERAETICFGDFARIESRVGRIISAEVFAEAGKPADLLQIAYLLQIDWGEALGVPLGAKLL